MYKIFTEAATDVLKLLTVGFLKNDWIEMLNSCLNIFRTMISIFTTAFFAGEILEYINYSEITKLTSNSERWILLIMLYFGIYMMVEFMIYRLIPSVLKEFYKSPHKKDLADYRPSIMKVIQKKYLDLHDRFEDLRQLSKEEPKKLNNTLIKIEEMSVTHTLVYTIFSLILYAKYGFIASILLSILLLIFAFAVIPILAHFLFGFAKLAQADTTNS